MGACQQASAQKTVIPIKKLSATKERRQFSLEFTREVKPSLTVSKPTTRVSLEKTSKTSPKGSYNISNNPAADSLTNSVNLIHQDLSKRKIKRFFKKVADSMEEEDLKRNSSIVEYLLESNGILYRVPALGLPGNSSIIRRRKHKSRVNSLKFKRGS